MFAGTEQLAMLVAHVARCLVNPGGMMQGEELDAASDIASGPAVVTGLRTEQALWTVVVELAGTAIRSRPCVRSTR